MNRLIATIIAIAYLHLGTGMTVHVHYCMGKVISESLIEVGEDHHCSHCGMEKKADKNGCCKDEQKLLKIKADHSLAKFLSTYSAPPVVALMPEQLASWYQPPIFLAHDRHHFQRPHGPPPEVSEYLHIRNCVFRI